MTRIEQRIAAAEAALSRRVQTPAEDIDRLELILAAQVAAMLTFERMATLPPSATGTYANGTPPNWLESAAKERTAVVMGLERLQGLTALDGTAWDARKRRVVERGQQMHSRLRRADA